LKQSDNFGLQSQLDQLEELIRENSAGIGRSDLTEEYATATGKRVSDRTLMRRLAELIRQDKILAEGNGPATKYRSAVDVTGDKTQETNETADGRTNPESEPEDEYIPLSEEGQEIRELIGLPVNARPAARFNPDFLEGYQPGITWYLTDQQRALLRQQGQTPAEDQPAGTYAKQIFETLLIDLSWASSHLEGNKYSKLDTRELLQYGRAAEGADATETQMILNHRAAIAMIVQEAEEVGFNRYTFLNLHGLLSENLLDNKDDEGRLRTRAIEIGRSTYVPTQIPQIIDEHFDMLLGKAAAIPDPFEQAFFLLVHIPYLQPFIDVNKRTSRIGANLPLIKANLCPLSFVDVPKNPYLDGLLGVYELQRIELLRDVFMWAYERSAARYESARGSAPKPDPIRLTYREQLRAVVRDLVRQGIVAGPRGLRTWARVNQIPAEDLTAFVDAARAEFLDLHEGSLAKFGLRPSEYKDWMNRVETLKTKRRKRAAAAEKTEESSNDKG
jgi:hypothetical protein